MMLGKSLILAALAGSVLGMVGFALAARGRRNWLQPARWATVAMTLFTGAALVLLLNLILTHQFQFTYVYRYSSSDLPLHFLISSLWGG